MKKFSDYKQQAGEWITLASGEFYPDILEQACELYKPVLTLFGQFVASSGSSRLLFMRINEVEEQWMRIQLCRVFRKYVSPMLPVEMLKKKSLAAAICDQYEKDFRQVHEVQRWFSTRPLPDEALCAILWEYKDRGKKGYDLTESFFNEFVHRLKGFDIIGPKRGGKDLLLHQHLPGYPNKARPVDFIILQKKPKKLIAIGFAHYDSDRGGSQEDSRTGEYVNAAKEISSYLGGNMTGVKIIFLNDGPGLLLGSMWNDYARIEAINDHIMVLTMRMMKERLTKDWLLNNTSNG